MFIDYVHERDYPKRLNVICRSFQSRNCVKKSLRKLELWHIKSPLSPYTLRFVLRIRLERRVFNIDELVGGIDESEEVTKLSYNSVSKEELWMLVEDSNGEQSGSLSKEEEENKGLGLELDDC